MFEFSGCRRQFRLEFVSEFHRLIERIGVRSA